MGASFRTKEQIIELAGCDFLTISPQLLEELASSNVQVTRKLDTKVITPVPKIATDEKSFRWALNEDEMAENKLAEGIRKFAADLVKLEQRIQSRFSQS